MRTFTWCRVTFWGNRHIIHGGQHMSPSRQSWISGIGVGGGKATIYALVGFSNSENPAPNVFSRGERRGVGVVEDWRTEQADTKRPYVYVVALWLKIMNTKIICNMSGPQYIRSALLARLPILAAWDTFGFDMQVFRGFSCMKGVGQDPHPHKEALYQPGV